MKKIFKALSILVATATVGGSMALASGCSAGYNGVYQGEYHYTNAYGANYGVYVEVTVENNIITSVKDITNTDLSKQAGIASIYNEYWEFDHYEAKDSGVEWDVVSPGWETYFHNNISWLLYYDDDNNAYLNDRTTPYKEGTIPEPKDTYVYSYAWTDATSNNWTNHESWLVQQYIGWSVADILDISVYTDYGYSVNSEDNTKLVYDNSIIGEPYLKEYNSDMNASGLLITGSTQGSGRLLLAVQNALKNKPVK